MAQEEKTLADLNQQMRKLQELLYYFEGQEQYREEDCDYAHRTLEQVINQLKQVKKSSSWCKRKNVIFGALPFNPRCWMN